MSSADSYFQATLILLVVEHVIIIAFQSRKF
jgi:hypothetical protein